MKEVQRRSSRKRKKFKEKKEEERRSEKESQEKESKRIFFKPSPSNVTIFDSIFVSFSCLNPPAGPGILFFLTYNTTNKIQI